MSTIPDVAVDLLSPTSDRMKNSFIITSATTKNYELMRKHINLKKPGVGRTITANSEIMQKGSVVITDQRSISSRII